MKFFKIINLTDTFGNVDYKGLNINQFIAGSQVYAPDLSVCIIATTEQEPILTAGLLELSEHEYTVERDILISVINSIPKPKTLEETTAQIEEMQALLTEMIMGGM